MYDTVMLRKKRRSRTTSYGRKDITPWERSAAFNVRDYREGRKRRERKARYGAASRSHDAAVILNEAHVSRPPTSWSWLIIYTSISSVFDVPPSGSRHSLGQKSENRGRFRDSRLGTSFRRLPANFPPPHLCHPVPFFPLFDSQCRICVSGSTNWS